MAGPGNPIVRDAGARDALGRRSRLARTPSGKRLILRQRDIEILHWLYRYRYLRQSHLARLLQPRSVKRLTERLGDLFHETGLIRRPLGAPGRFDLHCTPMLYEISETGIALLQSLGRLPHRVLTGSLRTRPRFNAHLLHTMMVVEALLAVELETLAASNQRFVTVDEILARAPPTTRAATNPLRVPVTITPGQHCPAIRSRFDTHIIPDALYGIEYLIGDERRYRFWALECERTSPRHRSTARASSSVLKAAAYDALVRSGRFRQHWGIPNLDLRLVRGHADC